MEWNWPRIVIALVAVSAPILIYWFIVAPRLKARFIDLYSSVPGFWARWWARAVAFRTMLFGSIGLILPEMINGIALLASNDLSALPDGWQSAIRVAALIATILGRAVSTTPREEPPKG